MKIITGATLSIAGVQTTSTNSSVVTYYRKDTCASVTFLAKAKPSFFPPSVHTPMAEGSATPRIAGSITDFITSNLRNNKNHAIERILLLNLVKECPRCGKSNVSILDVCNGCGSGELSGAPIIETGNVFTGFIFGFEKSPFPLKISLRQSTSEFLVFDDLFPLAPLHFNAIPTCHYIRDWRYLLLDPVRGLGVVNGLFYTCCDASSSRSDQWRKCFINDSILEDDDEEKGNIMSSLSSSFDIMDAAISGFNSPPSQFQLHLQFMSPMLFPYHWATFLKGKAFTKYRFFPREYVVDVLKMMISASPERKKHMKEFLYSSTSCGSCDVVSEITPNSSPSYGAPRQPTLMDMPSIDTLVSYIREQLSLDYDTYHTQLITKVERDQARYARWLPDYFEGAIEMDLLSNKAVYIPNGSDTSGLQQKIYIQDTDTSIDTTTTQYDTAKASVPISDSEIHDIVEADKKLLQGYGRPYASNNNKPIGCYNPCVKEINDVEIWGLMWDNRSKGPNL
eukprot:Tbor_TRINITY_DN4845_c0_g1::TRINITY_DN4845_c0_g1_i1::g.1235::m.1235